MDADDNRYQPDPSHMFPRSISRFSCDLFVHRYPRSFRGGSFIPLLSLDIVREGASESMVNYGQIIAARDDKSSKKDMYTRDAWMGMRRLGQYGRLVESMEEKEKLCKDCVRNRR